MKNHWRDPNPHEKEIITEWTRTIERYEEPFLQVLTICFTILALFYVFYSRISGASSDDAATAYFLSFLILVMLLCISLHSSHRHKQIFDGNYQIQGAVVAGSKIVHGYRSKAYGINARKFSGETVFVRVFRVIYGVARKHSCGYLLSYGKKAPGKYAAIHDFFPAAHPNSFN